VLDELGLGAALEELSGRYVEEGLEVHVDGRGLDGLDTALTAAAYGIISEAVANVSRHAGAEHCWVEARFSEDGLRIAVADDGVGMAADARPGVGSQSMRERATEQGGRLDVSPRPGGGTVVLATFPTTVVVHG
jgi:signal transduction histidine kinase